MGSTIGLFEDAVGGTVVHGESGSLGFDATVGEQLSDIQSGGTLSITTVNAIPPLPVWLLAHGADASWPVHWGLALAARSGDRVNWIEVLTGKRQDRGALLDEVRAVCRIASQPNWDSEGAVALAPEVSRRTGELLRRLPAWIATPDVYADPIGRMNVEWQESADRVLTISIGETDEIAYAWLAGSGRGYGTEQVTDAIPPTLLAPLFRVLAPQTP